MECTIDNNCPVLYTCEQGLCQHRPVTHISPQTVLSIFLIPFLCCLSNRIGLSTIWTLYPILVVLMSYKFQQSLQYVTPLSLAASFVMLYLALREKNEAGTGPAINFYVVNVTIPVLIVSCNIGLLLSEIVPFLAIGIVGVAIGIVFLVVGISWVKDVDAREKINIGHFRKMLPSRLQNSRKTAPQTIQLALIQQADSQIQQHEHEMSPTRKTRIRTELLESLSNSFPVHQFLVCLLSFLAYQCLCMSVPEVVAWLGATTMAGKLGIGYGITFALMLLGELYLYKFYVQPTKIQEEAIKLNLGLQMDGLRMMKVCAIGFAGGLMEGFLGFGFSFALLFYLLQKETGLRQSIATCGFFNIFISTTFTLNSIFCGSFHWLSFLVLFLLTLLICSGFQYLLNSYLQGHILSTSLNSTLLILVVCVLIGILFSLVLGVGLEWVRFGLEAIDQIGSVETC